MSETPFSSACRNAAVATALREPHRRVICMVGDGGFMMTGNEMIAAVQRRLPILFILANNGSYASIRIHQERAYPSRHPGTDLFNPDFLSIAQGFGLQSERIEREDAIQAAQLKHDCAAGRRWRCCAWLSTLSTDRSPDQSYSKRCRLAIVHSDYRDLVCVRGGTPDAGRSGIGVSMGAMLVAAGGGPLGDIAARMFLAIGMIMLVGLLGKNAILIVEFAVQRRNEGVSLKDAAIEGGKLRFRAIQMTSFAFIAGLLPLVVAHGAGAVANRTIGVTGVGGMLMGTVLGVLVIPMGRSIALLANLFGTPKRVALGMGKGAEQFAPHNSRQQFRLLALRTRAVHHAAEQHHRREIRFESQRPAERLHDDHDFYLAPAESTGLTATTAR